MNYRCISYVLGMFSCTFVGMIHNCISTTCMFRYVSGLDGLKRLQTVRFDDETLVTPDLNVYQPSSADSAPIPSSPPPSDPTNTDTNTTVTTSCTSQTTTSTLPDPNDCVLSQPSTSTSALDDLSVVSSLLGSLSGGLTVPGFSDTD